jgi:small subunit ribosomal protein S7
MRKRRAPKRLIVPDPNFNDVLIAKFTNSVMKDGEKSVAQGIIYSAFEIIEERVGKPGVDVFKKAISNVRPMIEVRARRVGGATYQVPTEVRQERSTALAIRWILQNARSRREKSMAANLASELIAASNGEGNSIKKRDDTHRMAEANKAFAHFRW